MSLLKVSEITDLTGAGSTYMPGHVVQVVQTVKSDTFSASVGIGGTVAVTGLSATITPKSADSKIYVVVDVIGSTTQVTNSGVIAIALKRGATNIARGDEVGVRPRLTSGQYGITSNSDSFAHVSSNFLDSPATTSATTYSVELFNISGAAQTLYVNRSVGYVNAQNGPTFISTITLMEIAQ